MKKYYAWALLFGFIFIEIIFIVMGTMFSLKITGLNDTEILGGLIGFAGAILGGILTLGGVYLTIRANKKSKEEEDLPVQIYRVEESKNFLERLDQIEMPTYISRDPYDMKYFFIEVDEDLRVYYTNTFELLTVTYLEELRRNLTFVDTETYKMFLDTHEKITRIELEDFFDAKDQIMEFQELMIKKHYPEWDYEEQYGFLEELDDEDEARFNELMGILWKADRRIHYHIDQAYGDLYIQLSLKHDDLIKELKKAN
ncbi:hypothetical protein CHH91_04530 [Virgibacillus sp. 7505]|uniref:hypothetical protein n=1 Tax=Virgibacillus sp. 7505 TaxID=2022548 RepID=UPI000BA7214A|nr:hypothetical protein [Virgibacillus sp. 7505]PAE17278.1 hypothetical protein CHH91_04530 [Virgibacillus sp. 7505]